MDLDYQKPPRLQGLWEKLPPGWEPDYFIWWGLYFPLPEDLADCPCPRYLIVSDWHPYLPVLKHYLPLFDWVFADRALLDILANWGFAEASYWPAYSFAPQDIPARSPDQVRDIDIAFIGNLNPRLHSRRSHYLRRLAALSDRYRVVIQSKIYGEDYFKLLQRSRLVFNHSLRGEMNLRAYEAPACGALLLMEADNREIRDFLTPDEACVLYTSENFESQIHGLLADPERCARIAAQGQQSIGQYSWEGQFENLLRQLPTLPRRVKQGVSPALGGWIAAQHASCTDVPLWHQQMAHKLLQNLLLSERLDLQVLNNWLVLQADRPGQEILSPQWVQAIWQADQPLLLYNLAWFYLMQQDFTQVEAPLLRALLRLSETDYRLPDLQGWLALPLGYSGLHVRWLSYWEDPRCQAQQQRKHLLAAGMYLLCLIQVQLQGYAAARQAFEKSIALIPDWPEVWQVGAALFMKMQALSLLEPVLEQMLMQGVFYPYAWLLAIELKMSRQAEPDWVQAREYLKQALCLFQAQEFAPERAQLVALSQRLRADTEHVG